MVKERSSRLTSSDYSENNPQFFKIYFPHHCSQRLRIPPAFTKYFNGVSFSKSILKTNRSKTSSSWCVDVNKINGRHFFENGWPEFVQENSIKSEDFLVFCYNGDVEFYVAIFEKNNCLKQFRYINTENHDEQQPVSQGTQTDEQSKSEENMCINSNVKTDTAYKIGTKKPFFERVLTQSYLNSGFIYVPIDFVKNYMLKQRKNVRLKHSNRTWLVKMIHLKRKRAVFSSGWRTFVADNALKDGDVCRFELVTGKDDYAFNVYILRGKSKERRKDEKKEEISERTVKKNSEDASSSEYISNNPFFQITLPASYVNKCYLNIPSSFQNSYMDTSRETARLQHSNKWWDVKVNSNVKRKIYFCGGWTNFVQENNLQVGDICSFELINMDDYVFDVSFVRGKSKGRRNHQKREEFSKRSRVDTNIENASSSKFISNCPFFRITMTPTYVSKGFLNISSSFQNKYMNKRKATARLKRKNKWWEVNLKGYENRALKFSGGWDKFANENSLQIGDVCRFELINMNNYVFNVSIARARTHPK